MKKSHKLDFLTNQKTALCMIYRNMLSFVKLNRTKNCDVSIIL